MDQMRQLEVIEVLDVLEGSGIHPVIDGGWGVDALIGRATRRHSDLDLVIDRWEVAAAIDLLRGLHFEHDASARPGAPARVVLRAPSEGVIDLHPVVFDAAGNGWQELDAGAWGLYPADGLRARGAIANRSVRCITPELQLRHHLGYPWTAHDVHDMGLLKARFGLRLPPPYTERPHEIPRLPPL